MISLTKRKSCFMVRNDEKEERAMAIQEVKFKSLWGAKRIKADAHQGIISIQTPGFDPAPLCAGFEDRILRVYCRDTEQEEHDEALSKDQAKMIAQFVLALKKSERSPKKGTVATQPKTLWVHCWAGVSRSAGCAKAIAEVLELPEPKGTWLHNRLVYERVKAALLEAMKEQNENRKKARGAKKNVQESKRENALEKEKCLGD